MAVSIRNCLARQTPETLSPLPDLLIFRQCFNSVSIYRSLIQLQRCAGHPNEAAVREQLPHIANRPFLPVHPKHMQFQGLSVVEATLKLLSSEPQHRHRLSYRQKRFRNALELYPGNPSRRLNPKRGNEIFVILIHYPDSGRRIANVDRQHRIGREPEVRQDPERQRVGQVLACVIRRLGRHEHAVCAQYAVRGRKFFGQSCAYPRSMMPGWYGDPNVWPTSWMWAPWPIEHAFHIVPHSLLSLPTLSPGGSCVRETGWNLFEEARLGVGEVAAEHA